jgi:uncharacterized membrane protein YvlD (DUF360 family)
MASLVLSTVAFVFASYFVKRYLEEIGIPRGMTRGLFVFIVAALIAYAVAYIVDLVTT